MTYRLTFKEVAQLAESLDLRLNTQNNWHKIVLPMEGGGYREVFNSDGRLGTCWAYLCGFEDSRNAIGKAARP